MFGRKPRPTYEKLQEAERLLAEASGHRLVKILVTHDLAERLEQGVPLNGTVLVGFGDGPMDTDQLHLVPHPADEPDQLPDLESALALAGFTVPDGERAIVLVVDQEARAKIDGFVPRDEREHDILKGALRAALVTTIEQIEHERQEVDE